MSEVKTVTIASIDPNPMRQLGKYPFNEKKIETLMRSIADVGLWEGVIGRKKGNRLQIAFGHHRVEASKRELGKDGRIQIIVRDLSDEQMIQFMGRENLEDYNADFLVMLESWEAGSKFVADDAPQNAEVFEVAKLLGWIEPYGGDGPRRKETRINKTAMACADASRLIQGGYLRPDDLAGLAVRSVQEICGRVVAQHEQIDRMARRTQRPAKEVEQTKKISGKAGAKVAKGVRAGEVAARDIRGQVDVHAYRHAREARKQSPLFSMFGKSLADQVAKVAKTDMIAEKFHDIKQALGNITLQEDIEIVRRLALECGHASKRFDNWQTTFSDPKRKIVKLKEIGHG